MRRLLTAVRHRLACACGAHRYTLLCANAFYWACVDCPEIHLIGGVVPGGSNRRVRA